MLRYLTAGESHGKGITAILDGLPANLKLDKDKIDAELKRRMSGYGRGGRMKIESDEIEFLSGVRGRVTTGAPVAFIIKNRDYENWKDIIGCEASETGRRTVTALRPGHADYAGAVKFKQSDARNILERASARETAARVAAGAILKQFLSELGITIGSHVINIAGVKSSYKALSAKELIEKADLSPVRCMDKNAEKQMMEKINFCMQNGDTAGGAIELIADGMPVGVGSHTQYDKKLDFIISGHLASVQAVKSVEIGLGLASADVLGSLMHDEMYIKNGRLFRKTNNAGGIEGGISNGENIVVKAALKPIPTLMKSLDTVDLLTKQNIKADNERSDFCAVPAASVVLEGALALALGMAVTETFAGDHMDEVKQRVERKREEAF